MWDLGVPHHLRHTVQSHCTVLMILLLQAARFWDYRFGHNLEWVIYPKREKTGGKSLLYLTSQ